MSQFKRSHSAPLAVALIGALAFGGVPTYAFAETSAELQVQLDEAEKKLNSLYAAAEQAGYQLTDVQSDLQETNDKIAETEKNISEQQAKLAKIQEQLSDFTSREYKTGGMSLVSLLANSNNFSSMVSNALYATKVSEQKADAVAESKQLQEELSKNKTELEQSRAEQEKLVQEQKKSAEAANAAAADAQAYYDALSDEVKTKIEEEQAAARAKAEEEARAAAAAAQQQAQEEAQRQAQQQAQEQAQQQQAQQQQTQQQQQAQQPSTSPSNRASSSAGQGGSSSNGNAGNAGASTAPSSAPSTPTASASAMVARAYSIIGSGYRYTGYVWTGSPSSSAFTCSGVVDYALGLSTNSNSPGSLLSQVKSRGTFTSSAGNLKRGDLAFYSTGGRISHVGIYIGGGQVIDSIPGGGVGIRSVNYVKGFIGGGSII